jgi:hypothetical protein
MGKCCGLLKVTILQLSDLEISGRLRKSQIQISHTPLRFELDRYGKVAHVLN